MIERLLAIGHTVHATWRGGNAESIQHLLEIENAALNLRLFKVTRPSKLYTYCSCQSVCVLKLR